MQRRQLVCLFNGRFYIRVHHHGPAERLPPVDNPVADACDAELRPFLHTVQSPPIVSSRWTVGDDAEIQTTEERSGRAHDSIGGEGETWRGGDETVETVKGQRGKGRGA